MKFVHAADLHLDSPLRGLSRYEGAPVHQIRGATRRALENLVALCIDEEASLLLIAGDLFDGSWHDYSTGLFFCAQMSRLRQAGIAVVMVRGNHDAASQVNKNLAPPDNVRELSARKPETVVFEDLGVVVHGQSFATRSVTEDLASGYPERHQGMLNIGLLHTSVDGRPGHDDYAPTSLDTLKSRGYDYWALGHVHEREVLHDSPWVVFPGNLQARHMREPGAKGATLVTVREGHIDSVTHQALDVVRFDTCHVDATGLAEPEDVMDAVRAALADALEKAQGRTLAARVVIEGRCEAHAAFARDPERWTQQARVCGTDLTPDGLWVEKVRFLTRAPHDATELAARQDAVGQLTRSLSRLRQDETELTELLDHFADLRRKLPAALREGPDALGLDDPAYLASMIDDVEELLLVHLLSDGEER